MVKLNQLKDKPIRLLIANRGEISIRVARAAAEIGLTTVSIYTYEDRFSQHRYKTDEAYMIGSVDEPLKPYLSIDEIIRLAQTESIDMIHPGYGFLSENVEFAKKTAAAGITFVGPDHKIMLALGDKLNAKKIARQAGVPVIEGFELKNELTKADLKKSNEIGYPLIIKAVAGGGGRGMRLARSEKELAKLVKEAKIEAFKAFSNDSLFIEKFVSRPKHIEVQILGDKSGNIIHLFERDCSVQRRFQKIVEVAPCLSINPDTKQKLYDYAIKIAQFVNYFNAGTVEFLVDENENIFFIEVNPRVQVEHTVTEEITGIDIVRTQLLLAMGYNLSDEVIKISDQNQIRANGVAIQCRITAEDPLNNFNPDYGTVTAYRSATGHGIRLDESGIYSGINISPFFDSLLVKVTAFGRRMPSTCLRMLRALKEFRIRGVNTNIGFLIKVLSHPEFQAGKARVDFIEKYPDLLNIQQLQDSATKTLTFLADVIVNKNPDIKQFDENKVFSMARLPAYDAYQPIPKGTLDILRSKGRDGFCKWLKKENKIYYTDTTFRDAHQSLIATRLRSIDLLRVADAIAHKLPNLFSLEVWGGATFDVCMRFLKENPWQRLRMLREKIPNIPLQMLFRGSNGVGYSAYPKNVIEAFIEQAAKNGIDIFRVFDSLNWLPSIKDSVKCIIDRTDKIAEVSFCYTGDILDKNRKKYDLNYYLDLAKKMEDMGAHIIGIKDMAGLLTPYAAELLIGSLKNTVSTPIHLHTHDTSGVQAATYLKAIEAGVDVVDVAVSSMSGMTSQPNFNSVVNFMRQQPREHTMDIKFLNEMSEYFEEIREYYYPFESDLKSGTAEVYQNEIPGGQYSNLRSQTRAMGLENKFREVKKNYIAANQMFGDLVKVTPSSKVVGDFAIFLTSNNLTAEDVMNKGNELSFPESVINFFKGDLGQPPGGFPKELQKIILKNIQPYTDLPNKHLSAVNLQEEFLLFKGKFDEELEFTDFLSYMLYPKVFEEYYTQKIKYGEVYKIPTPNFFYGIPGKETIFINLSKGKDISISHVYTGAVDEKGMRSVMFRLNGAARSVLVRDKNAKVEFKQNQKVDPTNYHHVGAPLQGKIVEFFVGVKDKVKLNQPLFSIEAMKMETTVTAPRSGRILGLHIQAGTLVQADDLVITLD